MYNGFVFRSSVWESEFGEESDRIADADPFINSKQNHESMGLKTASRISKNQLYPWCQNFHFSFALSRCLCYKGQFWYVSQTPPSTPILCSSPIACLFPVFFLIFVISVQLIFLVGRHQIQVVEVPEGIAVLGTKGIPEVVL